jgi:ribosomal protein S18 acetylase RimI-like enzyme
MDADFRLLTLSDAENAADVIAQAFVDDPLCAFMLPFRPTRVKTLYKFFRAYGAVNIKNQRGYGSGASLQGVAYWQTPTQANISLSVKGLGVFLPLLFTFYPLGYFRAKSVFRTIDALHQKYAREPHFYLDNIGVLPQARGRGISSKLIRPLLAQADSQNAIAYTDTVTKANVSLYQHFGFEVMEQAPISGTDITVWALRRSPR